MTFQPGNKLGGARKKKPFRDALLMELAAVGDDHKALRLIARRLISTAMDDEQPTANVLPVIKEVLDRVDGKVAQAIVGDADEDAVQLYQRVERVIVKATDPDSGGVPPAAAAG